MAPAMPSVRDSSAVLWLLLCAGQRLAAACSSWVQSLALLGGDARCTMLMHDQDFLGKLANDPPRTFE
jgi:hypothetical protein